MQKILLLLVLLLPFGLAQAEPFVTEIYQETDPFNGSVSCLQRVDNGLYDDHGVYMGKLSNFPRIFVRFVNGVSNWSNDSAWLSEVLPNDRVYILFPDGDVETYTPDDVSYDFDTNTEQATIMSDDLAYRLLASPGDIMVRFDGSDGRVDFTINHAVFVALAAGFGQTCLD